MAKRRYGNSMREGASYEMGERSGKRSMNPGNSQYYEGPRERVTYERNDMPMNTDYVDRSNSVSRGYSSDSRRYANGESNEFNRSYRGDYPSNGGLYRNKSSIKGAMQPNNPAASFIKEDWNEPALLKRGVHEFDVTYHANKHRSGRIGDLYEQVDKTTREDQNAFDNMTDPHNW